MLVKSDIDDARKAFMKWVQDYKITRRFSQGEEHQIEGQSDDLIWSVVWNWDERDAQILPGFLETEDTSGYYLAGEPWSDGAWEDIISEAVTVACDLCQGSGIDANEDQCPGCGGQGSEGDDLEELSSGVNFLGEPLI
jgi:hypothetical protein